MARPSKTGGRRSEAKTRKASPAKGRKTAKLRRRPPVSDPIKELKKAQAAQTSANQASDAAASAHTAANEAGSKATEAGTKFEAMDKANKILTVCRISLSKTIGGLSARQRGELVSQLRR